MLKQMTTIFSIDKAFHKKIAQIKTSLFSFFQIRDIKTLKT